MSTPTTCPECDQPMGKRTHPDEYRHASGCPLDDYDPTNPAPESAGGETLYEECRVCGGTGAEFDADGVEDNCPNGCKARYVVPLSTPAAPQPETGYRRGFEDARRLAEEHFGGHECEPDCAYQQPETEGERCCIKNGNAATPKGGEFLWCDRHSEGAFETEGMMFGEWLDRQFRLNPAKFGSLTYDELRAAWTAAKNGGRS